MKIIKPIIAIILARQNSKGIPLKNLAKVGDHSLLARAILAAQESGVFDRIIVSTDGELIAQEARRYNAEVVMRPDELASDTASSISGVLHVLEHLNISEGVSCLLQPTSPLRTAQHIQEAYEAFKTRQVRTCVSVKAEDHHPYKTLLQHPDGHYVPVHEWKDLERPRQQLWPAFSPNGAIYFNHIADLKEHKAFFVPPIHLYLMDKTSSIDIDRPADLDMANHLIKDFS